MDLEMFLKQDIKSFLNQKFEERKAKLEKQTQVEALDFLTFRKDYEKELKQALEQNNLLRARDLFKEVLDKYKAAKSEPEKELFYRILYNMYKDLKAYLQKQAQTKSADELIDEIERMGVFPGVKQGPKALMEQPLTQILNKLLSPVPKKFSQGLPSKPVQPFIKAEIPILAENVEVIKHPELVKELKKKFSSALQQPEHLGEQEVKNFEETFEKEIKLANQALDNKQLERVVKHYRNAVQAFKHLPAEKRVKLFSKGLQVYNRFKELVLKNPHEARKAARKLRAERKEHVKQKQGLEKTVVKEQVKTHHHKLKTVKKHKKESGKNVQETHIKIAKQLTQAARTQALEQEVKTKHEHWLEQKLAAQKLGLESEIEKLYDQAVIALKSGDFEKAKQLLTQVLEKNPKHIAARIRLLQINESLAPSFANTKVFA